MKDTAISVKNIEKKFRIPKSDNKGITGYFKSVFGVGNYSVKEVINGISFDVKKGECFGILGPNGTGKSTLMKLLAGVLYPDKGTIELSGEVFPLLNLGVGLSNDLTAKDNVYQYGALLGLSDSLLDEKFEEIFRYAELEGYENLQLKYFSSGMRVRLAFSIAMLVEPDIVLMDEVLSVGDVSFRSKSKEKILEICSSGKTVVIVSHSTTTITDICDRAMFLKDGKIGMIGESEDVVDAYLDVMAEFLGTGEKVSVQARKNRQIRDKSESDYARILNYVISGFNLSEIFSSIYDDKTSLSLNQYFQSKKIIKKIHLEETIKYTLETDSKSGDSWALQVQKLGDEKRSKNLAGNLSEILWDCGIMSLGNNEFSEFFSENYKRKSSFVPKSQSTALIFDDSRMFPVVFDTRERIKIDESTVKNILKNAGYSSFNETIFVLSSEITAKEGIKSLFEDNILRFIISVSSADIEEENSCLNILDSLVTPENLVMYDEKPLFFKKSIFHIYDHDQTGFGFFSSNFLPRDYKVFYNPIQNLKEVFSKNSNETPLSPDVYIQEVAKKNARYFSGVKTGSNIDVFVNEDAIKNKNRCIGKLLLLVRGEEDALKCYRCSEILRLTEMWFNNYRVIFSSSDTIQRGMAVLKLIDLTIEIGVNREKLLMKSE